MQNSRSQSAKSDHAALHEKVTEAMARLQVPGAVVGLLHGDEEHAAGFGVTSLRHPLPVDPDTLFQIGSITKTFTATAVMRLAEQDQIDLQAPIRRYLPGLRLADEEVAAAVTMEHLLTHMGGWVGDYFDDLGRGEEALARYIQKMADLAQLTPLGAIWSYNNAGFCLAGRVIEVVTGEPYESVIRELLLEPLGMRQSCFFAEEAILHRVSVGHNTAQGKEPEVADPWAVPRCRAPAGGLLSTVRDMLRYARFHLGDGRTPDGARLLRPDTLARMQAPHAVAGSVADAVGLSWLLDEAGGVRIVWHGGATNGQTCTLTMLPERRFAMVILTNANCGVALYQEVARWARAYYLDIEPPEPAPLRLSPAELETYVGSYEAALDRVDVGVEGEHLKLTFTPKRGFPRPDSPPPPAPPPVPAAFFERGRIMGVGGRAAGNRGEFLRDAEGRIVWLRWHGRIHARQE